MFSMSCILQCKPIANLLLYSLKELTEAYIIRYMLIVPSLFSKILFHVAGVAPGFFRRGLTFPTRGLKCGFQRTINAKKLRQNSVPPSDGAIAPGPPLAPPQRHSAPFLTENTIHMPNYREIFGLDRNH